MKILQVSSSFKPAWGTGGTNKVAYEISKHLVARKHKVTVFTTDRGLKNLNIKKNSPNFLDGMEVYYFKNVSNYLAQNKIITPYYSPLIMRKLIKNFDLIHIHEHRNFLALIVYYYAKKNNVPYILQEHGSLLEFIAKERLKKAFDYLFGNKILINASKLIAVTQKEADQYKKWGLETNRIEIVPNGINISDYTKLPKKGQFREKYNINNNEKVILYLGRINKIKGIDLLVSAFEKVSKDLKNVKLVIAGPDDGFLTQIQKQVKKLKLSDRVIFTGPLYDENKLMAYVDADIYVLPSKYEIFGITALEALACGIPVIITENCGICEYINENMFIIGNDENELKNSILSVLNNKTLNETKTSDKDSIKFLDWKSIILDLEKIYNAIL